MLDKDRFQELLMRYVRKAKAIRDRAWEAISSIVILEPEIYYQRKGLKHVNSCTKIRTFRESNL